MPATACSMYVPATVTSAGLVLGSLASVVHTCLLHPPVSASQKPPRLALDSKASII